MELKCDWCSEQFVVSDALLRDGETVFDCPQGHATMFTGTPPPDPRREAMVSSRARVFNLTRDIPEDKHLALADGRRLQNVAELASILDQLDDGVYDQHVTGERNDFRDWVLDVFEDEALAAKIPRAADKKELQLLIYRHMAGHD